MKRLLIRAGFSLLGMVLVLAWWTWGPKGKQQTHTEQSQIPAKVLGGGQTLEIDAESSSAATMSVSFEDLEKPSGERMLVDSHEKIPAGPHSWTIDVPAGVGGYIELEADHPNPGDTLTMRVHMNGDLVDEQSDKLDSPLQPNTAFFVQDHFDDYSKAAEQTESER